MKIAFIGAGKVACTFGHYLKKQGISIAGYYSKTKASAVFAAEITQSSSLELKELVDSSTHIFITTPDDIISDIWSKIRYFDLSGKTIFHMSGSIPSDIFEGIEDCGAFGFSLHPLTPIANKQSFEKIASAIFTIEGKNLEKVQDFLRCSKINCYPLKAEHKPIYHAAAVFTSNYSIALANISKALLTKCEFEEAVVKDMIILLMSNVVDNLTKLGINEALTGPIVRGDVNTIKKHLDNLGEYTEIYKQLGLSTLKIAEASGKLEAIQLTELNRLLGGVNHEENCRNL